MANLKKEALNKCFSLLREFIDETSEGNNRKGVAVMALNQLERVTAGTTENANPTCVDTPLIDGVRDNGQPYLTCVETPLIDGTPPPGGG